MNKFALSTLGYLVSTFTLAILWHIVLFADVYEAIGYIQREEPGFALGFLSILVQGAVIAYLYPLFKNGKHLMSALFVFHWSMHVVAAAAKNRIENVPLYFGIETIYLIIQFSLAYLVYSTVYKKA